MKQTKTGLDEAIRTQMRDEKEQREYEEKERHWMNLERD